jgi:transposase
MLQIVPQMKIFLARQPVDFRKGIDGLAGYCRSVLGHDPFSGALFIFCNRRRTGLKILVYDGQGFWLCHKRLSEGRVKWWPKAGEQTLCNLGARQLQVLLWNGDPTSTDFSEQWRPLHPE